MTDSIPGGLFALGSNPPEIKPHPAIEIAEQALKITETAIKELSDLRSLNALVKALRTPRKRGRPRGQPMPSKVKGKPGRKPTYTADDLAAFNELMPKVRQTTAFKKWLSNNSRRDSERSALLFMCEMICEERGRRKSLAALEIEKLRKRLNEYRKTCPNY